MRSIRLLPIVIFAALALLLFKGIGLVTNGSYILGGPTVVAAAESGGNAADMGAPSEATMTDNAPSMDDTSPTMTTKPEAPASGEHGEAPSSSAASGSAAAPEASSAASSAPAMADASANCPDSAAAPEASAAPHGADAGTATACPSAAMPTTADGDALPTTRDASGKIVPLAVVEGDESQQALLARLGERRAELDKREADLALRTSLLQAAEQKLDERTKALQDLETKVAALVDQKQAEEDASFKGIVQMYQQMKAKDAARIFDNLQLPVLIKIARAMNPRNVAPILAAMSAGPAQQLTIALASPEPVVATPVSAGENLAALPQIVGH